MSAAKSIKIRKHLNTDIPQLPELHPFIGKDVEIDVKEVPPAGDLIRGGEFWASHTLDELAAMQGVEPRQSDAELSGDWPESDSLDELLAEIKEGRSG